MSASAGIAAAADEEALLPPCAVTMPGRRRPSSSWAGSLAPGRSCSRELSKRYGADYQILACGLPAELAAWMRDLRAAGLPVALVIGGVGGQDRGWHRGAGRGPRHRPDGASGGRGQLG